MGDPLSTIRSVAALHEAQADQLRSSLLQLADRIAKSLSAGDVHVASENAVLDRYGDGESVYGFLSYSNGELTVAYRSTEDDLTDGLDQHPGEPTYSVRKIQDCPFKWLRAVSHERVIGSLFGDMIAKLDQQKTEVAALYKTQGQYAQAEPLYKHSLAILEKALGPDHPEVATSLNNLAELYLAKGEYAQAEPLFKRARAILEKAYGPDHPHVAASLSNMAALYRKTDRVKEAEALEKRAAAIRAIGR